MKRIKFMLLAIAMLLAAPAFLTSCQEDAPEINYTMNVSVINDFTKVVEAINNGSLKNEQAIAKLTEAIDKMNADQQAKLQTIIDVLNSVNATLETKLALIEAAIKAQTLSMETKLDLLEQAIKALPDYTSQLEAIKTAIEALPNYGDKLSAIEVAIKAMPDYSDKFDAVVDALNAMKTQIEALGTGQTAIATQIGEVTAAINSLIAEVNSGNTSAAAALAQIIQKLEELKAAIGSGGGSTPVFTNTVTIDGVTMPILSAAIYKLDLEENHYAIVLFLSEDEKSHIVIEADGKHHNGKTLDLTQQENEHDGWYWAVRMYNPNLLFYTFATPAEGYTVFLNGTLLVKRIGSIGAEFEVTLKDGKVKCEGEHGDGFEHTVSLDFKGELKLI